MFFNTITVCDWNNDAATTYGELRAVIEKSGKIINDLDQRIATHVISRRMTIVTNDRSFRLV
ncbi:TPA: VapC toxin family PIN domain ribonuclease, partial [Enterobacter chengduensis]